MTNKHLHIVTLDTPWPVNYGGVIDLFYKLKALHKLGIQIHLHCFCKNEVPQFELNKYCVEVNYYKRNPSFSLTIPYIVNSRKSHLLLQNLNKDNHPILLEGIHCTYYLFKNQLQNRKVFVRLHNVEFEYYKHLAKNENNIFKRLYFLLESKLLKKYEASLANKATFLAVNENDCNLYQQQFNAKQISFLPVFIEHEAVQSKTEKGSYCLYHGNLSINENVKAVEWLLHNVFATLKIPFVVAGKNPSKKLVKKIHSYTNACVVENPSQKDMQDLIAKAQINILPSFNATGVKLKLINALFVGKHCISNTAGVVGSGLEKLCHVENTAQEFKNRINQLFAVDISEQELNRRQHTLLKLYNNEDNVKTIIELIS
ncbi:MAG: glycosyltransferase [Ferruginibacter sp.]|nr:glycosyltransferase [Ferruginibacter sp.]